jgi:tRNA U55 pseudouridine synthase TruB
VKSSELEKEIAQSLSSVPRSDEPSKILGADFRQDEIRERWSEMFKGIPKDREFQIVKIQVICASGAYMRTLVERIGTSLGTTACALSINRTKIGRYISVSTDFGFWIKAYP